MNLLATTIFSVLVWLLLIITCWLGFWILVHNPDYMIEDEADEAISILRNN